MVSNLRTLLYFRKHYFHGKMLFVLCLLIGMHRSEGAISTPYDDYTYYTSVCEGQVMDIQCPKPNMVIYIESANFGRTDRDTCAGLGDSSNTKCFSPNAIHIVTQLCNQKRSCSIDASVKQFRYDPCPGTFKYLEAYFYCEMEVTSTSPAPITSKVTTTVTERESSTSVTTVVKTTASTQTEGKIQTTVFQTSSPSPTTVKATTTLPPNVCPATRSRNIYWPETAVGVIAKQPCPEGSTGTATWICRGLNPQWVDTGPDLSDCKSNWIAQIPETNEVEAVEEIADHVTSEEELYASDIQQISTFMTNSIDDIEQDLKALEEDQRYMEARSVTKSYLSITSAVIAVNNTDSWKELPAEDQSASASSLLVSVEESAYLLSESYVITGQQTEVVIAHEEENVLMEVVVQDVNHGSPVDAVFPQHILPKMKTWKTFSDNIVIPKANFRGKKSSSIHKVVFVAYSNIAEFLGAKSTQESTEEEEQNFVNSRVLSASLGKPMESTELEEPASITFQHLTSTNASLTPRCSYWKFTNKTHGGWSTDGCEVTETNNSHTTCSCNHLTNFAIIMDVRGLEIEYHHHFLLSWITYVGFIISCICLICAFVTFCMFKNLQNDRTTIHKNLCLCLLIAEILFMAGISHTRQELMCGFIAMFLHYFFLAAFAWMCLEGIQLYVMLVEVFESEHSRRKYYYPFGYGVPLIIVGVAALVDFEKYGTESACWLSTEAGFIWAFVGPVCLIVAVNTVFLTMALYIMCRHSKLQTNPKEKTTQEKLTKEPSIHLPAPIIPRGVGDLSNCNGVISEEMQEITSSLGDTLDANGPPNVWARPTSSCVATVDNVPLAGYLDNGATVI